MRSHVSNTCSSRALSGPLPVVAFTLFHRVLGHSLGHSQIGRTAYRSETIGHSGVPASTAGRAAPVRPAGRCGQQDGKTASAASTEGDRPHRAQDGRELDRDGAKVRFDIVVAPARDEHDEDRHYVAVDEGAAPAR